MRKLKNFCVATMLVFTLSLSVFAGDIHTGAVAPPPPPPATQEVPGDQGSGGAKTDEPDTIIVEITLTLLQLLSVY